MAADSKDEAADGVPVPRGQVRSEQLVDLVHGHLARDPELAATERLDERLVDVELVDDLADQLLDEILEGHHARRAAVLVDDDGEMELPGLHLAHERGDSFRLGDVVRRPATVAHGAVLLAAPNGADEVLRERDPDHVVEALVEHGDPAVAGLDRRVRAPHRPRRSPPPRRRPAGEP